MTAGERQRGKRHWPYQAVCLLTTRGHVDCRYYPAEGATKGVVWVGGAGGGWDTPANWLYPSLAIRLNGQRIASLRVRFRNSQDLTESLFDVLSGIAYLREQGVKELALVGHSFGGAVVIQAAAAAPDVRTVITLATQTYGADPVADLSPDCSILLIHGTDDRIIPPDSSEWVYELAGEPKELLLYPHAGHVLDEVADDVHRKVEDWLTAALASKGPGVAV